MAPRRLQAPARAAGLLLSAALVGLAWSGACGTGASPPGAAEVEPAWSTQLHLHGSFSEGLGSMQSQAAQAAELGVDVLWWSDHDYDVGSYRLVSTFGFEQAEELIDENEPWRRRLAREDAYRKTLSPSELSSGPGDFEFTAERALAGRRSLRVRAGARQGRWHGQFLEWGARRGLQRRTLATGVRLELAIFPEQLGADARAVIQLELSEHAPHFEQHVLRYHLAAAGEQPQREGRVYRVPLAYEPGRWNEYALDVSADASRGFPELPAGDDLLFRVALGVEARAGAEGAALFDRLRVSGQRVGQDGLAAQRELLAELGPTQPGLTQLQGLEISYEAYHLNEFSLDTPLPDYEALVRESGLAGADGRIADAPALRAYVSRRSVEAAHARGGLVSYNHMFGAALEGSEGRGREPAEVLGELLAERAFGADLLEVGYRDRGGRDLDEHLWVWDRLSDAGLRLVGTGVSDYHGGAGADAWRSMENNFVSWIRAARPDKPELLAGLRAGRVFFGDIARFDGLVELETPRGFGMGDVVLTDRASARVTATVSGLPAGARLRLVGASGLLAERAARRSDDFLEAGFALAPERGGFCRLEVRDAAGAALVLSNPIWFARAGETAAAPLRRWRLDVAGVRDLGHSGVELYGARPLGTAGLLLELSASAGEVALDLGPGREGAQVELTGLVGAWRVADGVLELSGLAGRGRAELRW